MSWDVKYDIQDTGAWMDDNKLIIRQTQDVEPYFQHNRALANHDDGYSPSKDLRRIGSIPNVIVEQWMKEGIDIYDPNDTHKVLQKLNSSEYRHLRTADWNLL